MLTSLLVDDSSFEPTISYACAQSEASSLIFLIMLKSYQLKIYYSDGTSIHCNVTHMLYNHRSKAPAFKSLKQN